MNLCEKISNVYECVCRWQFAQYTDDSLDLTVLKKKKTGKGDTLIPICTRAQGK